MVLKKRLKDYMILRNVLLLSVCWCAVSLSFEPFPFYSINRSFEENIYTLIPIPLHSNNPLPAQPPYHSLLGYPLHAPIGVAACALTTSRGIALASDLGFSVLTYKTVCRNARKSHAVPNVCYVACEHQLTQSDIGTVLYATDHLPKESDMIAISNSVGNACPDFAWVQQDIAKARACIKDGQVLIVSIYGEGADVQEMANDFAAVARGVQDAGGQIIEINLSCPNVCGELLYKNPEYVYAIVSAVLVQAVTIPVIIKLGIFENDEQMRAVLVQVASAGARGVCGINTVPVQIKNKNEQSYFGQERVVSGLSGAPIRSLAKQFVVDAVRIIKQEQLDLVVLATGGITKREHFTEFLDLGAAVALSATAFMYNPFFIT